MKYSTQHLRHTLIVFFLALGFVSIAQPIGFLDLNIGTPHGFNDFGPGKGVGVLYAYAYNPTFSFGGSLDYAEAATFSDDFDAFVKQSDNISRPYGVEIFSFAAARLYPVWWKHNEKHVITLRLGPSVNFTYAPYLVATLDDRADIRNYELYDASMRGGGIPALRLDAGYAYALTNFLELCFDMRVRAHARFERFSMVETYSTTNSFSSRSQRVSYRPFDVRFGLRFLIAARANRE